MRKTETFFNVPRAAEILNLDARMIRQRCKRSKIGFVLPNGVRILTADDLELIRKAGRPRGNPNFSK